MNQLLCGLLVGLLLKSNPCAAIDTKQPRESATNSAAKPYIQYVQGCIELLMRYGTDRYGPVHSPILVSILDVETRTCPPNPEKLEEDFRVIRRGRRNPAGANLLPDQPLLKTMYYLSTITGEEKYAAFAQDYSKAYLGKLVDEQGFIWWGWHRHYDVYRDIQDGHEKNHHEIQAIHCIDWEHLYQANPSAVAREIEAIWQWHVIDNQSGEVNRHGDGQPGCDFSMTGGAIIEAFVFWSAKTKDRVWLDRAKLVADYYWNRRNPITNLFPERPNAGCSRFDGSAFVTSVSGLYCHSLLKAYQVTGQISFRDQAIAYLDAYAKHGYDPQTGKYWGALQMDGTFIPGPRICLDDVKPEGAYAVYEPRGHLDLWEPYVAGYQFPIYTAQAYAYAYQLTGDGGMLETARRFAKWIDDTPPGTIETEKTWYDAYSRGFGRQGTYADKYGRATSFFLHLYVLTGESNYLASARKMADEAIANLYHKGFFRGHPAKPYYESVDGVGYLLYALLELDHVMKDPDQAVKLRKLQLRNGSSMDMDNW